jgi:tRNA (cmo5U34)-methyltransferase
MATPPEDCLDVWQSHDSVEHWMKFDGEREALLRRAGSLLPFPADAPIRVLDVGAGHGPFAGQILREFANSSVCLQDFSDAMVREAATRLACFPGRFEFHRSDLRDPSWAAKLCDPFDAVVSALVIHSLDQATVRRLYADCFGLLCPEGCFFNLDLVLQPPESGVVAGIYRAADSTGFSHHRDEDESPPPTLEEHLRWLREGGFGEVDCIWKHCRQALLCGVRTATLSP